MTTPPPEENDPSRWSQYPQSEPVSLSKPADEPLDFDPYRFGAPDYPIAPEYAPPGYRPPAGQAQPAPQAPYGQPARYGQQAPQYPSLPQAPAPPSYNAQYPQPSTGNGKATAALVLGIASIVLCWTSVLDIIPIALAIVFGILGRNDAVRLPNRGGRGMAVSGLICALVGAVLATTLTIYFYGRIKPCLDYSPNSSQYKTCIQERL